MSIFGAMIVVVIFIGGFCLMGGLVELLRPFFPVIDRISEALDYQFDEE